MSYLTAFGTSNPDICIKQTDVVEFMIGAHGLNEKEAHELRVLYRATGINQRFTTIPDYSGEKREFFNEAVDLEPFPTTKERNERYRKYALTIAENAARECLVGHRFKDITHLITISCTGLYAPGLDIELIENLGLDKGVERTAINYMGCYAAFNALKTADYICRAEPNSRVLVVAVEMCTLHFQKENTEDNLLANALFGDGGAAVLVEASVGSKGIELRKFRNALLSRNRDEMAWTIGDHGFNMKLSAYVPDAIKTAINPLLEELDEGNEFDLYAIHPGGRRILTVVEEQLAITKNQNAPAHHVLRNYGNMSSPTILFVLKEIFDALESIDDGKSLLGFAFGPGLTLESLIGKVHYHG